MSILPPITIDVRQQWLVDRLQRLPELTMPAPISIDEVDSWQSESAEIRRFTLTYAHERHRKHVITKVPHSHLRPSNNREVEIYRQLPELMTDAPLVRCHAADYYEGKGAYFLALTDLTETHRVIPPGLPPTRTEAYQIVGVLAHLHAQFWDQPQRLVAPLAGVPSDYDVRRCVAHAECYFPTLEHKLEDRLTNAQRRMFQAAFAQHTEWLWQRFSQGHLTLLHGDPHAANFLLPRSHTVSDRRVYLIDWQSPPWVWTAGCGVSDVVYMMVRYWPACRTIELAMPLLMHYFRALHQHGVKEYSWDQLLEDFHSSCLLNLYIVIEEACRTEPRNWYPQFVNAIQVVEHFHCTQILAA